MRSDMKNLLYEAEEIKDQLIAIRRTVHQYPEPGRKEFRTAEYIESLLHDLHIETNRYAGTGVVGIMHGKGKGKCVLFRSDMDALPVMEETGLPYASKYPGVMHACGHDMHIASLIGCAMLLKKHEHEWKGTVKFLFEPDEEGNGGAQEMIGEGVLENPYVNAVFGAHCNPDLPAGTIGVKYGSFYASAAVFDVTVQGRGCHGAEPEKGADSLYAAALMCARLKEMTHGDGNERLVVSVGCFDSGTARNIIPSSASFHGIIRTCGLENRKKAMAEVKRHINEIAQMTGTSAEIEMREGYPGVVNHDEDVRLVENTASALLGREAVIEEKVPTMTTEDFGFFLLKRPGCFYHIGVGSAYGLHNSHFNPDENALTTASSVHAAVLINALGGLNDRM